MSVAISWANKMQLAKCDIMVGFPISSHIWDSSYQTYVATKVQSKQAAQRRDHDNHTDICTIQIVDPVFVRNYTKGPTWLSGEIKNI